MSDTGIARECPPTAHTAAQGRGQRCWLEGAEPPGDAELLAALLGGGTSRRSAYDIADSALRRVGGLEGLARLGQAALQQLPGLGPAKARRLAACFEIGRRVHIRVALPRKCLATPAAVAAVFTPRLGPLDHEQMWVVSLDGRNQLRAMRCVAQGGAHGLAIGAREILRVALADAASAFVLVHNHPSGDPEPSADDVAMTQALARAAELVGTPLLDHVVVTASGAYASLLDRGALQ